MQPLNRCLVPIDAGVSCSLRVIKKTHQTKTKTTMVRPNAYLPRQAERQTKEDRLLAKSIRSPLPGRPVFRRGAAVLQGPGHGHDSFARRGTGRDRRVFAWRAIPHHNLGYHGTLVIHPARFCAMELYTTRHGTARHDTSHQSQFAVGQVDPKQVAKGTMNESYAQSRS